MTFSYRQPGSDPSTDRVRLIIGDTKSDRPLFSDEEISDFIAIENGSIKRAAATALDAMASDEAMVTKAIKLLDLTTNGPAVATSLRDHARVLREQADSEEVALDFAEWVPNDFALRERLWYQTLRG